MSNPTIDALKAIAEEIARLESPHWFADKHAYVAYNEDRRVFRVGTTDGNAYSDIDLHDVKEVWLERALGVPRGVPSITKVIEASQMSYMLGEVIKGLDAIGDLRRRMDECERKLEGLNGRNQAV
jgi:hypothetical protein